MPNIEWMGQRLMSNLIWPAGLVPPWAWHEEVQTSPALVPLLQGEHRAQVLKILMAPRKGKTNDVDGPIPLDPNAFIWDPDRGVHSLIPDKYARALGVPKEWVVPGPKVGLPCLLGTATGLHIWHVLESLVTNNLIHPGELKVTGAPKESATALHPAPSDEEWQWQLPCLDEQGE